MRGAAVTLCHFNIPKNKNSPVQLRTREFQIVCHREPQTTAATRWQISSLGRQFQVCGVKSVVAGFSTDLLTACPTRLLRPFRTATCCTLGPPFKQETARNPQPVMGAPECAPEAFYAN